MAATMPPQERIHAKVVQLSGSGGRPVPTFGFDDVLLQAGLLDSISVLELIMWIESEFDIEIDQDELSYDNFGSINQIAKFIESKRSSA